MSVSKIAIVTGLTSLLLLSGCTASNELVEAPAAPGDDSIVSEEATTPESEAADTSEFNENEIGNRALLCEDILSAPDADESSSDYRGCLLETEIPNLAAFLSSDDPALIYHVITDGKGEVIEIVSFVDTNGNNAYDEDEKNGSYLVPLDIMTIDVIEDSNKTIAGIQVSGLSSMTFSPAA
jgi:hypothetical protein